MMRALYTAASGMRAQQTNVDNISNNIANVNTTAFKSQKTEFKSLLYQTIQTRTTSANGGKTNRSAGGTWNKSCVQHHKLYAGCAARG